MPNIFELSHISQIVESNRPARILVLDTNVLMNDPDPSNWSVKTAGSTLFLLPDSIFLELEFVRRKRESREKTDSQDKADEAIKIMAGLFKQGQITGGIPIKAGWIVSVPSPKQDDLDQELKQFEDIVKAFGRYDTKMLLLTKECSLLFENIPVFLITGEVNLFNVAEANGIACHLHTRFPIEDLKIATRPLNWDQVLDEIQDEITEKSLEVEMTLTDQRSAPPWLPEGLKRIIAEGQGVVRDGTKNMPFLWTVPFYPRNFASSRKAFEETTSDIPPIHLDFLGEKDFGQDLFEAIADRLLGCTNPSFEDRTPILQNPESIMAMLLFSEYSREGRTEDELEKIQGIIEETEGGYVEDGWVELMVDNDQYVSLFLRFMQAISRCWSIGHTYKFRIMV